MFSYLSSSPSLFSGINGTYSSDGNTFPLEYFQPYNRFNYQDCMQIDVPTKMTFIFPCCLIFLTINCTQWQFTQITPPLCCVLLDISISLQILSAYKAVIYEGITTGFVVIFLFVCGIYVCLYSYVLDSYKMLHEIIIISYSVSQRCISQFVVCPRQCVENQNQRMF